MMRRFLLTMICLHLLAVPARVGGGDAPDDSAVYERAIPSMIWLMAFDKTKGGKISFGSGVLIDAERGLVLTAYHVIDGKEAALMFLPVRDRAGDYVTDPMYYVENTKRLGEPGEIIARDAKRDLALIRTVRSLPLASAIPLAAQSAKPGQSLISIGNSVAGRDDGPAGVLWRFAGGNARQLYTNHYRFPSGQEINAKVVEVTVPLNSGDSGGPILNLSGELVGISSAIAKDQNQVHYGIDVAEIRAFLKANNVEIGKGK